jgi:hypothetical protein
VPPLCPRRASQESRNPDLTCGVPWNRTADLLPTREKLSGHRETAPRLPPTAKRSSVLHTKQAPDLEPPYGIEP